MSLMISHKKREAVEERSFLFCLCGDRHKASSRVRGYWIAEALAARGANCTIRNRHSKLALLSLLWTIARYDTVVFQKTYSQYHYWLLRWAKLLKKRTIVDLDDAPSRTQNPKTLRNIQNMMNQASAVAVGSRALAEYANQFTKNVCLIPSSICLKYYQPTGSCAADDLVCLGWIGNGSHYKQDLIEILKAPLTEIAQRYPVKLKLVGVCGEQALYDAFEKIPGLELDFIDSVDWSDPMAIAETLQNVDIGLYPLLPNCFNQYKCGFKALEYMAMKIPVISSDVAENREIINDGVTGLFARSKEDWVDSIERLRNDELVRRKMGQAGRAVVEERYSTCVTLDKLIALVA